MRGDSWRKSRNNGLPRSLPAIIQRSSLISHRRGQRFGAVGFGIRFGRRYGSCVLPFALRRRRPTLHGLGGGRSRGGVHACGGRRLYSRSRRLHGDQSLYTKRLLEPSFGGGAFLLPAVRRLLSAWKRFRTSSPTPEELGKSFRAVELHGETYRDTRGETIRLLEREGIKSSEAEAFASRWLSQEDFLLAPLSGRFDFVVGNPPYVRQEMIPAPLLSEYHRRFRTLYDRADLYIPFIERSLSLLTKGGVLGFICSDRWMKNRYGGPLRSFVASKYRLRIYVDMTDVGAFHSDVSAYPAITVIGREPSGATRIAYRPEINRESRTSLASEFRSPGLPKNSGSVREIAGVTSGADPWLLEPSDRTDLIRRLEENFPSLEEAGCSVGIGVATGADKAFIGEYDALDVEPDRKLPLVTTKDIISGEVRWLGRGIVNPFADGGGLVDLNAYPRLRRYLEERRDVISRRHCAAKGSRQLVPHDRPHHAVADVEAEAPDSRHQGRGAHRLRTGRAVSAP